MAPTNYVTFQKTLERTHPPENWDEALRSLWYAAKEDWDASHNIAQDLPTKLGHWIHAHLHRLEGDEWNAGYWYRQAGRPFPKVSLEEELRQLVETAIQNGN